MNCCSLNKIVKKMKRFLYPVLNLTRTPVVLFIKDRQLFIFIVTKLPSYLVEFLAFFFAPQKMFRKGQKKGFQFNRI